MKRVVLVLLAACTDHGPPPTAPIAVDVAPAAPITSGPLAQSPPPNPERSDAHVWTGLDTAEGVPFDEPAPAPAPTPPPIGGRPFDRGAAAAGLGAAPISRCALPGGPTGHGHVTVTFDPSGRVSMATVDQGAFPGTPTGACIARVYSTVTVPPYVGAPVRVGKSFTLP